MEKDTEQKSPAQILRDRKRWRKYSIAYMGALAIVCIIFGYRGWYVEFIPMHYVGYFLAAVGAAGMWGVNVWKGGPLDTRQDPTPDDIEDWVDVDDSEI